MSRSESKEKEIYNHIKEYFSDLTREDMIPSHWKVPIGGGNYDEKEVNAVVGCYLNGLLSTQKPVVEFEKEFASYIGAKHGIAVNSGTSANILALNALMDAGHLKCGDEVAIPATTFISVATPIIQLGLVPVYIDIEQETLNMNMNALTGALNEDHKIKCVMVVHTLGYPADMPALMKIADEYNLKVIEDCCEAHGAAIDGKRTGSFGDVSTWSFYVAHNMTTAEGGMIATSNDVYASILRELREFGRDKGYTGERYGYSSDTLTDFDERYTFHKIGWNFRMADAPAAFGREQLKKLEETNAVRLQNAEYLIEGLKKYEDVLILPLVHDISYTHVYYSFPIVIKDSERFSRKAFAQHLESESIETRAIMCGTLPDQPSLSGAPGRSAGDLANSRYVRDNGFFVGCHPLLTNAELDHIIEVISNYIEQHG